MDLLASAYVCRKPLLEDHLIKAVRPVIASNGAPYLQMTSVGSHSTLDREKEENMERMKRDLFYPHLLAMGYPKKL